MASEAIPAMTGTIRSAPRPRKVSENYINGGHAPKVLIAVARLLAASTATVNKHSLHDVGGRRFRVNGQADGPTSSVIELASDIASAYVSKNHVQASELPGLIASVHAALAGLVAPSAPGEETSGRPTPAQVRKSITREALISFIDGKPYKALKRHLTTNGLTIETYRERYGLPRDYPSTAASYSAQRSELARKLGLGHKRQAVPVAAAVDEIVAARAS